MLTLRLVGMQLSRNLIRHCNQGRRTAVTHARIETVDNSSENAGDVSARPFEEMPAMPTVPVLKSSWVYLPWIGKYDLKRFYETNRHKYFKYGKIVKEETAQGFLVVNLYDPHDIEAVFRQEGKMPFRPPLVPLEFYRKTRKDWFRNGGLLVIQAEEWYQFRTKVQQYLLKPKAVMSYLPGMENVAIEMLQKIAEHKNKDDEVPQLLDDLYKWALESIALVAMDAKLGCLQPESSPESEAQQMINNVATVSELLFEMMVGLPVWQHIYTLKWLKFSRSLDVFTRVALKYVKEAMERIAKSANDETREMTILELLLARNDFDQGDAMTMIVDMMLAGIDTTSHSMAFTLYHLGRNPEKQQKAYEEICKVIPNLQEHLESRHLNELRYLKACMKESMRLNPVIGNNLRILDHEIVLSGYKVPAKALLVARNEVSCRLKEYFPEPDSFKPERWLEGKEDIVPFVSLPFGFGPRSCIGRRIAEQEMIILLTKILQQYRLEYHHEEIGSYTRFVNVPDRPLRIKFLPRNDAITP